MISGTDNPSRALLFVIDEAGTVEDPAAAATRLAAATDMSRALGTDEIACRIRDTATAAMGPAKVTRPAVHDSTFTQDREATFGDVTAMFRVRQQDGSPVATEATVSETTLRVEPDSATEGTLDGVPPAAHDARMIIGDTAGV